MKTIRFVSDNAIEKQFTIEVRKNVGEYFRSAGVSNKGNLEAWIKIFVMLALYIGPFIILLSVHVSTWTAMLLVFMMGVGEAGIGMNVMHDASHGALSQKEWVNKLFASTMYILGSGVFNWKIQHNLLHHSFTNVYGYDQDIETKAIIRLCEHAPKKKYHRFQHIYAFFLYGLMTLSKLITDFGQLKNFNRSGITLEQKASPKTEMLKLFIAKSIYFLIILGLPIVLMDFQWWQILFGFSIMHIIAGIIMSTVFQTAHVVELTEQPLPDSNGIIRNQWTVHQLKTTSDFARSNRVLSWFIGGLNFQIEHHLFPNICHIHYCKIAPIVEKTSRGFGLPYNYHTSFTKAIVSHTRRLKELGK